MRKSTEPPIIRPRPKLNDDCDVNEKLRTDSPPGPDHPLLGLENVILTPHLSSWTPEALRREVEGAVDSVMACLLGKEIPGLINPGFARFQKTIR